MIYMLLLLQPAFLQTVSWLLYWITFNQVTNFVGIKFNQVTNFIGIELNQVTNFTFPDDVATPALSACRSAVQPGKLWPPQGFFSWIKSAVRH